MRSEEKTAEFKLESITEKDGKFYFTAISLTEEFEAKPCREILAKESVNKHLIYRHRHPIDDAHNHVPIFGTITNSKATDKAIISEYLPYDHTDLHKTFIDEVKEKNAIGDPIGISMRYRKYYDNSGKIIHLDVFEHSLTPFPKCEECLVIDEYIGEKNMPKDKKKVVDETINSKEIDNELEDRLKKIDELEKTLNSKTEALEEYKTKIKSLEKEIKKSSESVESETKTLEDRVLSLEEKLEGQKKDYEDKIDYLKKKPVLDELFEMRSLDEDEKKFYEGLSLEKLSTKKEQWSKEEIKAITKTMEDSAEEAQEVENEDEKEAKPLTEDQINEFVKDERIRELMKKQLKIK